ncbi:MAG: hypothetical protein Q4P20_00975 [Eubacteriales bacterium]|nr:hypothetical protein [Eubacteriales bacterium]
MGKAGKFFFAMAWFCFGVIMGFLIAPIKQGVDITIASNNMVEGLDVWCDDEEDALDEQEDDVL